MEEPNFHPEIWSAPLLSALVNNLRFLNSEDPGNPKLITYSKPRSKRWLRRRERFVKKWELLNIRGEDSGYLIDYGDGMQPTSDPFQHFAVPNPFYVPPPESKPGDTVRIYVKGNDTPEV